MKGAVVFFLVVSAIVFLLAAFWFVVAYAKGGSDEGSER
jgi:ABC-type transporter Mla subunit MlaD